MKELINSQSGIAHIVIMLIVIITVFVAVLFFVFGFIKNPIDLIEKVQPKQDKQAQVKLQTAYKNPFDKSAQYINPFSSYINPFDALK